MPHSPEAEALRQQLHASLSPQAAEMLESILNADRDWVDAVDHWHSEGLAQQSGQELQQAHMDGKLSLFYPLEKLHAAVGEVAQKLQRPAPTLDEMLGARPEQLRKAMDLCAVRDTGHAYRSLVNRICISILETGV